MDRQQLVEVALGRRSAETIVRGGRVVDVHTGEIRAADVAIHGGRIAAVGELAGEPGPDTEIVEAGGRYLVPGLIDTHIHHCHTAFGVTEFAETMLRHGVTAFADGLYGPAMIGGIDAVRTFKDAFDRLPIRLLFLVPVLAYAQNRDVGLPAAEAVDGDDMHAMLAWPGCRGLEEPPPFPVLGGDPVVLGLIEATLAQGKVVTGHAAGLSDAEYQAYAAAGASTDHETVAREEAVGKARAGLRLLARQGDAGAEDLAEVIAARTADGIDPHALAFCSDVAGPLKLDREGTIGHAVRLAIAAGVEPVEAIQMATRNAAEALGAQADVGSVAPGRLADILLVDDLAELTIAAVLVGGSKVVAGGELVAPLPRTEYPQELYGTVDVPASLEASDFDLAVDRPDGEVEVRALSADNEDELLITYERRVAVAVRDGRCVLPDDGSLARAAVVERLGRPAAVGLGFMQGLGLRRGAFATSLSALTMNLVVAGVDPADMALAAKRLAELGGGKVVVADGEVLAELALPVVGLHSDRPAAEVVAQAAALERAVAELGCPLRDPFARMEFATACQDLGELKLSERGLLRIRPLERLDVVVS